MFSNSGNSELIFLDWIVMGSYLVVLLGIGVFYRSFAGEGLDNYFLGGRKLKSWLSGFSFASTFYNAEVGSAYIGLTVSTGMFICWWFFSRFGLSLIVAGVLFAVFWRRLSIFTSPEFYEVRFSGKPAVLIRSWVSFRSACLAVVGWTGAGLLGLCFVANEILGWSRLETLLVVVPIILIYVYMSGYMGVVVSDVLQGTILIGTTLLLSFLVLADFGGEAGIWAGPQALYNSLVDAFPNNPEVVRWYPPMDHEFLGMLGIFGWLLGKSIGYGGDTSPVGAAMEGQRLLSTKSPREASKMYIWTACLLFLMLTILTLPGLGALALRPELYTAEASERELVFGWLLGEYMPPGVLGLALVALFAAIMSTVDSNMNLGGQVLVNDVYKRFIRPEADESEYMLVGKVGMIGVLVAGIVVALLADSVIAFAVLFIQFSAAELPANWAQWWWWRFNAKARIAASFGGVVIFLVLRFLIFDPLVASGVVTHASSAYMVVISAMLTTTILWVSVALLTDPDPEEDLIAFYKEVQPLGFWGPIRAKAGHSNPRPSGLILRGLTISLIGMTALCSSSLIFYSLYLGQQQLAIIVSTIALVSGSLFFFLYKRFLNTIDIPH